MIFNYGQTISYIEDSMRITAIDHYDHSDRLTVRYQGHLYHIYTYDQSYQLGDYIFVKGTVNAYIKASTVYGFDQYTYYRSINVFGVIDVDEISEIRSGFSVMQLRAHLLTSLSSKHDLLIKSFVFGESMSDHPLQEALENMSLLFLLKTTGLHAYIIVYMLKRFMFYFNVNDKHQQRITLVLYGVFSYLNAWRFGVLRLFFAQVLRMINHRFKMRWTPLDRLFVTFFVIIIIHFSWYCHIGLLMTFLILLTLELARDRYQKYHGYTKRLVMTVLIALAILPFTQLIQPIVWVCLPICVIGITTIVYPLVIMACFTSHLDAFIEIVVNGVTWVLNIVNERMWVFYLPTLNHVGIAIYYVILIYVLRAYMKKQLLIRLMILSSVFGYRIMSNRYVYDARIFFLDVGQGDSAVIQTRHCQLMIDAFEGSTEFLKNHGIYHLDYLFLTHSDNDHIQEAIPILNTMPVDTVMINGYDDGYPSYHAHTIQAFAGMSLTCGNVSIDILSPLRDYGNANGNSLVMKIVIDDMTFLFTGDIDQEVEYELVQTYGNDLKSDVLKVAHHGSDTSSSKVFIKTVNPRVAVISVGRYNDFGFPKDEVIQTLIKHHVEIYRTDLHGTIQLKYFNHKHLWQTTLPIQRKV